jgi:hypothetical protein
VPGCSAAARGRRALEVSGDSRLDPERLAGIVRLAGSSGPSGGRRPSGRLPEAACADAPGCVRSWVAAGRARGAGGFMDALPTDGRRPCWRGRRTAARRAKVEPYRLLDELGRGGQASSTWPNASRAASSSGPPSSCSSAAWTATPS